MPDLTTQQRQAAESTEQHIFVSAGAGCGKTMVLVERYLEVLKKNPQAGVQNIIAVTFTRKAAEEMRSRIKASLRLLSQKQSVDWARWQQLLNDIDRARIGTIHSLCESLLRTYPAEAGVDPQFEVLDDLTRAQLMEQSLDAALNDLFAGPNADASLLLEYPAEKLKEWMGAQLSSAPQYREARRLMGDNIDDMTSAALAAVSKAQHQFLQAIRHDPLMRRAHTYLRDNSMEPTSALEEKRLAAVDCLDQFYAAGANDDWNGMAQALRQFAATPKARNAGGPKGQHIRDALSQARSFADEFAEKCPAGLAQQDEQAFVLLDSLLKLIDDALARYGEAKRQSQKLDYNDMIVKTHELLNRPASNPRRLIGANLLAVLVDEFQDTNRVQSQLLCALCGPNTRLFLIGDDKQSIYKFQGADVSTFNEWKSKIADQKHELPGEARLFDLDLSFRSHPSVVQFVNRFFELHFSPTIGGIAHGASFQRLFAARQEQQSPEHVECVVYDAVDAATQKPDSQKARAMESQAIACWILEKVGGGTLVKDKDSGQMRPIEFGDVAILVQSNNDFACIEPALAAANIPFVTFAGGGFLKRQEILDIENLLRFLANPQNDHALLAVLRSPLFSMSDGLLQMVFLSEQGGLWHRLQAASRKEQFGTLKRPVGLLKQLLQDSQKLSISDLISNAIRITGFDVSLLAVPGGKQKSRNVWKMAEVSKQYDQLSLSEFADALESLRDMDAGKQSDAPLASENAVKLMTIHKAKGLEFAAVILPVLGRKVHMPPPKLLVHREYGISLDTSRVQQDPKPAYFRAAQLIDNELDCQEKKRLFYVAMTRARDWLVMFVQQNAKNILSFRLWLAEAIALNSDSNAASPLQLNQHYTTRYLDEDGLAEWEQKVGSAIGTLLSDEQMEALSVATDFSLLQPADSELSTIEQSPSWRSLARATSRKGEQPHATLVGDLFHAAMQQRIQGLPADDAQLRVLAAGSQISALDRSLITSLVQECRRLLAAYEDSDLSQMLQTASRIYSETNYTIFGGEQAQDKRPDLIVQDSHGRWHIIDFKTDKLDEKDVPAKLNEHAKQVLEYVEDFLTLTKQNARAWIYFAELGRLEEIKGHGYSVTKTGQLQLPLSQE